MDVYVPALQSTIHRPNAVPFVASRGMNLPSDSAAPPAKRHKPSCCFFTSHQSRESTSQIEEDARRKTVLEQWAVSHNGRPTSIAGWAPSSVGN